MLWKWANNILMDLNEQSWLKTNLNNISQNKINKICKLIFIEYFFTSKPFNIYILLMMIVFLKILLYKLLFMLIFFFILNYFLFFSIRYAFFFFIIFYQKSVYKFLPFLFLFIIIYLLILNIYLKYILLIILKDIKFFIFNYFL